MKIYISEPIHTSPIPLSKELRANLDLHRLQEGLRMDTVVYFHMFRNDVSVRNKLFTDKPDAECLHEAKLVEYTCANLERVPAADWLRNIQVHGGLVVLPLHQLPNVSIGADPDGDTYMLSTTIVGKSYYFTLHCNGIYSGAICIPFAKRGL